MTSSSRKLLLTGASGLLGRTVHKRFLEGSWEVVGTAFSRNTDQLVKLDLTKPEEVEEFVKKSKPSVLIHAAAQRYPDQVEKNYEQALKLNVESSEQLARISDREGISFFFISTDYVFDGSNPPYKETDKTNPLNKYGMTKVKAEEAIIAANPDVCILRIPVLYGDEEFLGESALSVLLTNLLDSSKCHVVSDYEIRFPSHCDDIAVILYQLVEKKFQEPGLNGVYQWCGSEPLTKYGMTKIISEVFNLPMDHITADPTPSHTAARPHNTQLCRGRLESLGIGHHTPFRAGIRRSFCKFVPNHDLS